VQHEKPTLVAHWLACAGSVIHDDDDDDDDDDEEDDSPEGNGWTIDVPPIDAPPQGL
jgi:hypothetical protein